MPAFWRIELFGRLRVVRGSEIITRFESRQTGLLLACLSLQPARPHPREELVELLWSDVTLEVGRNRLKQALAALRRQLEPQDAAPHDLFLSDRHSIQINANCITTDVHAFERLYHAAEREPCETERADLCRQALELYSGELLSGYYEPWALTERERYLARHADLLQRYIAHLERSEDPLRALPYVRQLLAEDPWNETATLSLMRLHLLLGQPAEALRRYQAFEKTLCEELDTVPSEPLRRLAAEIRLGRVTATPFPSVVKGQESPSATERVATSVLSPPPLPVPANRFFDRAEEIAGIERMLTAERTRLLTLTGLGGCGKTRLALEAAHRLREAFGGRVWCVPLAEETDGTRLLERIAIALGLPPAEKERLPAQVAGCLNGVDAPPALLLLDNFEQLAETGAVQVSALLQAAPSLRLLVTSRCPLLLREERLLPLRPLPCLASVELAGERGSLDSMEREEPTATRHRLAEIARCPSVALFVNRAQAVRPDFQMTPQNAVAVAAVCARLEGLPLAIELAAAWAQMLTPEQMQPRLTQRFDLLVGRKRDLPERHHTLRATLEGTYRLLAPRLQRQFAALAVFREGWTLEAAQAVGSKEGETALDWLAQLQDWSLITTEERQGALRFRMLETVREFAAEMGERAQPEETPRRHAAYYLGLAEEAMRPLYVQPHCDWARRLMNDYANLEAALAWTLEREPLWCLRLSRALLWLWFPRGRYLDGKRWLSAALERAPAEAPPDVRAGALEGLGVMHWNLGDMGLGLETLQNALSLWRVAGDRSGEASTLHLIGILLHETLRYSEAQECYRAALALRRELGETHGVTRSLVLLGRVTTEPEARRRYFHEALTLIRQQNDPWQAGWVLYMLGSDAWDQGDSETAHAYLQESLSIAERFEDYRAQGATLTALANIHLQRDDLNAARAALRRALPNSYRIQHKGLVAGLLGIVWSLCQREGRVEEGVRTLGALQQLEESLKAERTESKIAQLALQTGLSEARVRALLSEGFAMTLEQAVAYALQLTGDTSGDGASQ